jgi:uncharacterized protein (DUF488 family)
MDGVVYTVGHSNYPPERFLELLTLHGIALVGDVRSRPYSRMNPQFNRENLNRMLSAGGIAYLFLGRELGARSEDPACYSGGKVQYDRLARTELFRQGLERVCESLKTHRLALMCAEKDPLECHRTILVSRELRRRGVAVRHILEDGALESHEDTLTRLRGKLKLPEYDLFSTPEEVIEEAYRRQGERIAYQYEEDAGPAGSAAP